MQVRHPGGASPRTPLRLREKAGYGIGERITPPPQQRSDVRQDLRDPLDNRPWMALFVLVLVPAMRVRADGQWLETPLLRGIVAGGRQRVDVEVPA